MTVKLAALTWDALEPGRLARFWSEALKWSLGDERSDPVVVTPTDATSFRFEFTPTRRSLSRPNRIHLDLSSHSLEDQQATVMRFVELGAREIDIGQGPHSTHAVLADPEGNEFCILDPANKFVTYASRVGSLTCEGTRAVGVFWSEALGSPLVWDQNGETAIRAPDGANQFITWGGSVSPKQGKNRLHFDVAPPADGDQNAEVQRLISLGARRIDIRQGDASWVVMADPDDNEFCVLTPR